MFSKKIYRRLVILFFGLFFIACQPLGGTLVVGDKPLRVQRDDGFKVRFYKGQYPMSGILSSDRRSVHLRIERKQVVTDVTIKIPRNHELPENGAFELLGSDSGQTFDLSGAVQTNRDRTQDQREWEYCTYPRDEYVCRGRGRHRDCRWETVWVRGEREVEFHFLTTTIRINAVLSSPGEGRGDFSGTQSSREKKYTFIGECY